MSEAIITDLLKVFTAIIDSIIQNKENYGRSSKTDFINEKSPLCFRVTLKLLLFLENESIRIGLLNPGRFHLIRSVTSSAVTKARKKLLYTAYMDLFNAFNRKTRRSRFFKGFLLYAVDGSEITIRGNTCTEQEKDLYLGKSKSGKIRHFVHANALYDLLEQTYVDILLQPGSQRDERTALLQMALSLKDQTNEDFVLIADRGYEGAMLFYQLKKQGFHFLIRVKDESSSHSILLKHPLKPETDEYDTDLGFILSSNNKKALLKRNGETRRFMYISDADQYDEFTNTTHLYMDLRVVRFKVYKASGDFTYETLITNLPREKFTTMDLSYLYHMRWGVETGFEGVKYNQYLEELKSRCPELVKQEVWAKAALYNLASRIRMAAQEARVKEHKLDEIIFRYFSGYLRQDMETAPDTKPAEVNEKKVSNTELFADDVKDTGSQPENNSLVDKIVSDPSWDQERVYHVEMKAAAKLALENLWAITYETLETRMEMIPLIAENILSALKDTVVAYQLRRPDTRSKRA